MRLALAVEDVLQAALVGLLGLLGRHRVTVLPFVGHGTPDRVQVRARVVLGSRSLPRPEQVPSRARIPAQVPAPTPAGPAGGIASTPTAPAPAEASTAAGQPAPAPPSSRWRTLRVSLGQFLTVELPRCPVTVVTPGGRTSARADREGYVDALVEAPGLSPGWREVRVRARWRGHSTEVAAPVLVVDPATPLALVSDVDDTVIETGLTRGLEFLRLTLLTEVTDRVPLPGAAELYRALVARPDGGTYPVFYLSTSPWNLHALLARFIALRGFPPGPLLLTDWGPGRAGFFRIAGQQHKLTLVRQVLADHPGMRVVLVGDTGQIDPEIYATIATEAPDRVRAVYVRRTGSLTAARAAQVDALAGAVSAAGVPMLAVDDSVEIAAHAASIGLLPPAALDAIRSASGPLTRS